MVSVQVKTSVVSQCVEVMLLFSNKAAFLITEYEQTGALFARLNKAVQSDMDVVDVEKQDLKFVLSSIDVCSSRKPVDVQNFRAIADLRDDVDKALKTAVESKTDGECKADA